MIANTLVMYGIKNCDTIKKARKWLDQQQIDYRFHDYRSDGISPELLHWFFNHAEWRDFLNTRGTTWRQLNDELKNRINNPQAAEEIMLTMPAIIKRPVLVKANRILIGFNVTDYQQFVQE